MSIVPTVMKGNPGGVWTVTHADAPPALGGPHSGSVDPSTIGFGTNIDGSTNYRVLVIPCPVDGCGSVSYTPIGGGAAAPLVQEAFVRRVQAIGCPCTPGLAAGKPFIVVIAHIRGHAEAMDYVGRWQVVGTIS